MAISEIIKDIDYDLPDDIYHQTNELGKRAYVKYKGPSKIHVWINSITNKIQGIETAPQGEMLFNGEMPLPQGDHYLVEVDAEEDMTQAIVCAMFGGVDPLSIPDVEETVPGQTSTYVRDKYPIPDHTYERDEIEYSPTSDSFITPFPWRKPIMTWTEKLKGRDRALANSDRLNSEDLPSGAKTLVENYQKYLASGQGPYYGYLLQNVFVYDHFAWEFSDYIKNMVIGTERESEERYERRRTRK